jgi:type III secretion protein T
MLALFVGIFVDQVRDQVTLRGLEAQFRVLNEKTKTPAPSETPNASSTPNLATPSGKP